MRLGDAGVLAPSNTSSSDELIRTALRNHPTILFLHGNGETRVPPSRIQHYQAFASHLRARLPWLCQLDGYTERDLDARASWDWLRSHAHGAAPENVLIVGNSLGTAVAVQLAKCP